MRDRPACADPLDQPPPAVNGQSGITVGHEDFRAVQSWTAPPHRVSACPPLKVKVRRRRSIADHMRCSLVADAPQMAASTRGSMDGAVFHSDHGARYSSRPFADPCGQPRRRLQPHHLRPACLFRGGRSWPDLAISRGPG